MTHMMGLHKPDQNICDSRGHILLRHTPPFPPHLPIAPSNTGIFKRSILQTQPLMRRLAGPPSQAMQVAANVRSIDMHAAFLARSSPVDN